MTDSTTSAPSSAPTQLRALDELFDAARKYRTGADLKALFSFLRRLRRYSPYNAMLLHVQMPSATYVATASRWLHDHGRRVLPNARPLVILQPRGPVMFVFDVGETEPLPGAPSLPREITAPFAAYGDDARPRLARIEENVVRDGVRVSYASHGTQSAGLVRTTRPDIHLVRIMQRGGQLHEVRIPLRYEVVVNEKYDPATRIATLAHELAHLYCGHLGTPNPEWWPERVGLPHDVREFEAESVSYLVCERAGISTPSAEYLSSVLDRSDAPVPNISLEAVLRVAGLIEQMTRERLPLRPERATRRAGTG